MKRLKPWWSLLVALVCACNNPGQESATAASAPAACSCECPESAGSAAPVSSSNPALGGGDVATLIASANRKMFHEDGDGCLADLGKAAKLEPKLAERLLLVRAQCMMLTGKCQEGKGAIVQWYRREMNLSKERAEHIAESMASLRCRAGDSTERDQLLRAFQELSHGAFLDTQTVEYCKERVRVARRLAPRVPSDGPDDKNLAAQSRALYHTAAQCLARAGSCDEAWKAFRDNFPEKVLDPMPTVKRSQMIREMFESSVGRCAEPAK